MNENDIEVVKTEHFATFRQHVRPMTQDAVPAIFAALLKVYRASRISGPVTVNFHQGGVRSLVYDQLSTIPSGSDADKAVEELFAKQLQK